ncbi:UPF0236 family transposase-like protein, partial [Sporohalobacter salinus]|uniref:UPF0236 family transposase-like protein n=1 Tax=Sporohalobacter salinus TaxID=1494606 RepID=UPI0019603555
YNQDQNVLGCSAEGHVSHVLSARMSSRPLGWSKKGANQISKLRAFKYNGGTKEQIYQSLSKNRAEKQRKIKEQKLLSKKQKKWLYPQAKETVPVLSKGKVTGLFKAVKSLAY